MDKHSSEYREKMQAVVDKHLQGLAGLEGPLTAIQKQNLAMRFTLEFDERSYKTQNSLMARVTENTRKDLKEKLTALGDIMRQAVKDSIQGR